MKSETILLLSILQLARASPVLVKRDGLYGAINVTWGAGGFLGEFTVGGQPMDVLLDTGSCGLWVVGPESMSCKDLTNCYNPSNAEKVPFTKVNNFQETYFDGSGASGNQMVMDTLGSRMDQSFTIDKQPVQVASHVQPQNGGHLDPAKNGLIGMCRRGHCNSRPESVDTLATSTGGYDFFSTYFKEGDEKTWFVCYNCMARAQYYDESSAVVVQAKDDGHWRVDSTGWQITIEDNGSRQTMPLSGANEIMLDTGLTWTGLDYNSIIAIATAYDAKCSGIECKYPCYRAREGIVDGTPVKQNVKITLPWGTGGIPFDPIAFWAGGYDCIGDTCTCTFGFSMHPGSLTYGSGVFKSAYFKWDVSQSEITMYKYK